MPDLTGGEVVLDLGDEQVTLKPTLGAAIAISSHFDGFAPAYAKVSAFNLEAMIYVAQAGTGVSGKAAAELAGKLFKRGVFKIKTPLLEFIGSLSRGGQSEEEFAEKGEDGGNADS